MDRKKGQRYSKEFRHQAVERMNTSAGFSRELGVARHLLYNWRDRSEHTHLVSGRSRELILGKQRTAHATGARSHSLIKLRFSIRRGIQHASRAI